LVASLALTAALACGAARAADPDPETPDYLMPDAPGAAIETHRAADGRLHIEIQGGHFDGRRLIKRMLAAIRQEPSTAADADFDLHIAVGALSGFNREVLYDVDMRLAQRAGRIDDFALTGRTLDKAVVQGDVRNAKVRALFLSADDAGTFLRFLDLYGRLPNGKMWLALDLPATQEGVFSIRDFDLPNAPMLQSLRRVPAPPLLEPSHDAGPVPSRLHGHFTLSPGKVVVKDTALSSEDGAATMEGVIERGELQLRGALAPAMLADPRGPPCSQDRCLPGMEYRLTGPIGAPKFVINPFMTPIWRRSLPRP
jgi:hypothetical protein